MKETAILFVVLIAIIAGLVMWIVEDAQATTPSPAYMLFYGDNFYGADYDYFPCSTGDSLWQDGTWQLEAYGIPRDSAGANYDYLIIDFTAAIVWQVHEYDGIRYALLWSTFAQGADKHPHPDGAYLVECEF